MESQATVERRYHDALDSLVTKIEKDRNIIAAILCGSMSYDQVWDKSDIDLLLVQREGKGDPRGYTLTENDVNIHAEVVPRGQLRRWQEAALQGSFDHSFFSRSTLLFCSDESVKTWYQNANLHNIGARDKSTPTPHCRNRVTPHIEICRKAILCQRRSQL